MLMHIHEVISLNWSLLRLPPIGTVEGYSHADDKKAGWKIFSSKSDLQKQYESDTFRCTTSRTKNGVNRPRFLISDEKDDPSRSDLRCSMIKFTTLPLQVNVANLFF